MGNIQTKVTRQDHLSDEERQLNAAKNDLKSLLTALKRTEKAFDNAKFRYEYSCKLFSKQIEDAKSRIVKFGGSIE